MIQTLHLPDFVPTSLNRLMFGTVKRRIRLARGDKDLVAFFAREQRLIPAACPRCVSVAVTVAKGDPRIPTTF